jgi:CheY-like chemotaxis protein
VRQLQLSNALGAAWLKKREGTLGRGSPYARRATHTDSKSTAEFAGRPVRVLVAEDNVVNQKVALLILGKLGIRPDLAANGKEAVERFSTASYDLILMDCQMPVQDGYEASREIRRREGRAQRVTIVAMTADAMEGSREKCMEAGMDDYISKPVNQSELLEVLRKWLRPSRSEDVSLGVSTTAS